MSSRVIILYIIINYNSEKYDTTMHIIMYSIQYKRLGDRQVSGFFFYLFSYTPFFLHIMYAERLHNELRDRSRVEILYKTLVKLDPVPRILDMYAPPQNTERVAKLAKM